MDTTENFMHLMKMNEKSCYIRTYFNNVIFFNIFKNALFYFFIITLNIINIPVIKLSDQATIIFFTSTRFYFYNIHIKDILGNTSNHNFHQSNAVL